MNSPPASFDRLSIDQVMRLSALAPARVREMHCAALATWLDRNEPRHSFALPPGEAGRLAGGIAAAIANDAEMPAELAREFVAELVSEPEATISQAADREEAIAELAVPCDPLFAAAREGKPLPLHPLANASVVSPALSSCHAAYRAAAARSEGEEAAKHKATADRAAALALRGKDGAARTAAEAALAAEAAALLDAPEREPEAEMMRLIMCQPVLAAAEDGAGAGPGAKR